MTSDQNSTQTNNCQKNKQLVQSIINEMRNQGFLDEFIDEETGETLLEIQFSNETWVYKMGDNETD
jgi:glutamine synthetase